jgi:hypothetical protein
MDHYDAGSKSSGIDALTLQVLKVFGEMCELLSLARSTYYYQPLPAPTLLIFA